MFAQVAVRDIWLTSTSDVLPALVWPGDTSLTDTPTSAALVTWLRRARGPQEVAGLISVLEGFAPDALRPVESVLRDLETALEQVRVMVPPEWRRRVPPLVWAEVEFAPPRFRRWLMAWDVAHPAGLGALLRQDDPPDVARDAS